MNLYLVRGLPGSAKTTIAQSFKCLHLEMDMMFMKNAEYAFDPEMIQDVVKQCQSMCKNALEFGMDVVVSNTFTRIWEMQYYLDLAVEMGATLKVFKCTGDFGNTHELPEHALKAMADRWEDYDGEHLVSPDTHDEIYNRKEAEIFRW